MSDLFRIIISPDVQRMTTKQLAAECHRVEGVDDVRFLEVMGEVERRGCMDLFMEWYRELWKQ